MSKVKIRAGWYPVSFRHFAPIIGWDYHKNSTEYTNPPHYQAITLYLAVAWLRFFWRQS